MPDSYTVTRRSLHGLAELVLAGPRYACGGSIQLRAGSGGIETWDEPAVRLYGGDLLAGQQRVRLDGLTFADAAARIGLVARRLDDVYQDGPGLAPEDVIRLDEAQVRVVEDALRSGALALQAFAPEEEPILWPEHFDVGITVDEVNYGVSPGDGYHTEPYAYVSPWRRRTGGFWNAPFGAVRPVRAPAGFDALVAFFTEGRERARQNPAAE
jgi:hypothetical protein